MTEQELIEQLKQNRVPWYLLTDEEKKVFNMTGKRSCLVDNGIGEFVESPEYDLLWGNHCVYRIKPDYQPPKEPKMGWVEYPVIVSDWDKYQVDEEKCLLWPCVHRVGYGGVQYETPKGYHSPGGTSFRMTAPEPDEKCGPWKPVKIRFWREIK